MDLSIGRGRLILGDCLERMGELPDASVDMILCDLPYGTTQNKWDAVIPFEPLWAEYWRVAKPSAAVVLTAAQPFTSALVMSQVGNYKYSWIWKKSQAVGHLNAWSQPMRNTEDVVVFCVGKAPYFPQLVDKPEKNRRPVTARTKGTSNYGAHGLDAHRCPPDKSMPATVLEFNNAQGGIHPTQKPVALFEYLIRTYTDEGMTVLDNCSGSGTTAIAAERTGRNWICIERDPEYFVRSAARIWDEVSRVVEPS